MKVAYLSVSPTSKPLVVGGSVAISYKARDADGAVCPDCAVAFESSNTGVATVDSGGTVVAVARGSAIITARTDDASATVSISVS